jgi:integrase
MGFTGEAATRDIFTEEETDRLLNPDLWQDRRAFVGALVALTCGLRSGEIRVLRRQDIGENTLQVNHEWADAEKLKKPKNGETRRVPLLPAVRGLLLDLLAENPHYFEYRYQRSETKPDTPISIVIGDRRIVFQA